MTDFSDSEIQNILKRYKSRREKDREKYQKIKDDEEFKIRNRAGAKAHYEKNKELRKQKYQENIEVQRAKNSFYYYKRNDRIEQFQKKYPERYEILKSIGYFNEKNPSSSISTS